MKPLPLVVAGLALSGYVVAGAVFLVLTGQRSDLADRLQRAQDHALALQRSLASKEDEAAAAQRQTAAVEADLSEARRQAAGREQRLADLAAELQAARGEAATRLANEQQLQQDVTALKKELLQQRLTAVDPAEIGRYRATIAQLEERIETLHREAREAEVAALTVRPPPPPVVARVLTVGPKNSFVVLDYGASRGATVTQQLHVQRGVETVATIQISDVRENLSIAQVRPASLQSSLRDGDSATLLP